MELTSLSTFIPSYIKKTDLQPEFLDEDIIMEFATEAAQKLQNERMCNHVVGIIPVSNYSAPLPSDMYKIIETAYKGDLYKTHKAVYHDEVISWTGQNFAGCDIKVSVECPECHQHKCSCGDDNVIIKVDDEWLMSNTERHYWNNPRYVGAYGLNKMGGRSCFYHPEFSLIRPALHKFHGTDFHVKGCMNMNRRLLGDWPVEYVIDKKPGNSRIRINVEDGIILLAYLSIPKDDQGFPLVPDDVDAFVAIFWYVEALMLYRNKRRAKENYAYSQDAEKKALFYMKEAKRKLTSITPQEWNAIMRNTMKKIPYRNSDVQAGRINADRFESIVRRRIDG